MAKKYQSLASTIRSIYESKMMKVTIKGEGGATVPARTEKEAITKAFRKLGIASRFTKDAKFMKGVSVSEAVEEVQESEQIDELSRDTLSNYMRKSSADVAKPGTSAKKQDKRIAGQSMADKKIAKADGYKRANEPKVAASEETEDPSVLEDFVAEGGMKRMATQDAEKERLGPKKVKGKGLDTFKPKPQNEDAYKGEPVGVSVTMKHKQSGQKQTTKFPGTHSAVRGAQAHIDAMKKKGYVVHSKDLMYGKNEAAEDMPKKKGKKGEEEVMINPTVSDVKEARMPSRKQIMDVIGDTKNSMEGIKALKKKFRVNDKQAKDMLKSMMESLEQGTAELTNKYKEDTPGESAGHQVAVDYVAKPEVAPTAKQVAETDDEPETTYQKSLKNVLSRLKEIK